MLQDSLAPPQGLSSALRALATTSHPPAEFPFWVNSSICSAPPWVTCSDKPSCRHTICCGIVGLALAWGEIAKFTTLFAHPQLAPATTKNHTPCCPLRHAHPILVPKGVLCTVGMSVWSAVFGFTQSAPCTPGQFMKSPHTHTSLTAIFPMDGAPFMCPPYTLSIDILSIFPHPGAAMHVLNPVTSPHLDAVAHLVTHILERLRFNTVPTGPSFRRLAHSLQPPGPPAPSRRLLSPQPAPVGGCSALQPPHHPPPPPSAPPASPSACLPNWTAFPVLAAPISPCQPSWASFSSQTSPSGIIYPMVGVPS